ncbi:MAG: hypothetical protein LBT88_01400 [Oscillospiraceae bacterium]|nr:hypothetical protein [Oscillospiraceae bacterium]
MSKRKLTLTTGIAVIAVTAIAVILLATDIFHLKSITGYRVNKTSAKEVLSDSYIYGAFEGNQAVYYRDYFDGRATAEVGRVNNFVSGVKETALLNNVLYFYNAADNGSGGFDNNLYGIDLSTNRMQLYYTDNESSPAVPVYPYMGKVLALKTQKGQAQWWITHLEIFDPNDGSVDRETSSKFNAERAVGSMILTCCTNGEKIYALTDKFDKSGIRLLAVDIYNKDFEVEQTLNIDKELSDYINESRPSEIAVFGNYIYMRNYSAYGVVGKIEDGLIKPVVKRRGLELALNQKDSDIKDVQMFYVRGSNTYYILNITGNTFEEKSYAPFEHYQFLYSLATDDDIIIFMRDDREFEYLSDLDPDRYVFTNVNKLK